MCTKRREEWSQINCWFPTMWRRKLVPKLLWPLGQGSLWSSVAYWSLFLCIFSSTLGIKEILMYSEMISKKPPPPQIWNSQRKGYLLDLYIRSGWISGKSCHSQCDFFFFETLCWYNLYDTSRKEFRLVLWQVTKKEKKLTACFGYWTNDSLKGQVAINSY